jgi:hypothetical protein
VAPANTSVFVTGLVLALPIICSSLKRLHFPLLQSIEGLYLSMAEFDRAGHKQEEADSKRPESSVSYDQRPSRFDSI